MDHLDLAGVLTTPPQWNLPAFEQQDAIYLSSSRQMLEPIMEETSEDEEYALNSWQQYDQQGSDIECAGATEVESACGGTGTAGSASFWSSAESDTGSVIRVEINKDNDSTSERDFLCPAKRPRRCEESLAQSLNEEEVILRRPLYADLKNNSLERFLNYENFSRDSWGANSQQRSSVGSRRGFDDFYSDSDSLSYNSLSRSSSLIQFESLERQLLMQEQHASMNSLGNSSPSLLSFETNEDAVAKGSSNSGNNSANNSRRGSQSSLLKKYESLDGRLHQTYYDLDKLNFDDMNNGNSDSFVRATNLKISSHMAELRSDSESSSEGSEGSSRPQSVLSPRDCQDNNFLMKNTNSQQIKKGKSSAENLSEDSGYCEPSLGHGLRRSKSQTLLKNYEKFSEEEEEMENKSLLLNNNKTQTFIELNAEQEVNNKHSIINEFKNITTRQETSKSPPLSPHLEFIRHKQRTEAHSPSPVSSEVSTSSSASSQSTNSNNSHNSSSSSSSATSTSSATTCASKASFTWLMPSASNTARHTTSSSRVLAEDEKPPSQISINDLRELQTSNEENVQIFSGKLKNCEKVSSSSPSPIRVEYVQVVANENECLDCKNNLGEYQINECRNCGEKVFSKLILKQEILCCQKCNKKLNFKEKNTNYKKVSIENSENVLNCKNCGENFFVDLKLNEKVRKKIYQQQLQLLSENNIEFVDTEINGRNCFNECDLDYDSAASTPEFIKRVQSCENSPEIIRKYKNVNSSCKKLLKTAPNTCSASSDSDYSPLRLRKKFHSFMPSWPAKTSSVPNDLNTIGRKKKTKKAKTTSNSNFPEKSTDNDYFSSSEDLQLNSLHLKRSLSWSFQQNLELATPNECKETQNLGLLHQSYHNLAVLDLELEHKNILHQKMAEKRISSDYETEIVCKNNFLLDELSAHFDRSVSILNDKPADETDAGTQPTRSPQTLYKRKTSNSSCSATEESETEQVQHVSLVIRKPPTRQKLDKGEEKTNSLNQDYSFASIMQSGGKTFDQDPTMLKTSYAQSLEKCNFDCREISTQDLSKARAIPKRRFHSQANCAKKKNLVSSTPNLNSYDFNQDDIDDDMFVSSAHTSMHQLPLSQTQKPLGILVPAGSRTSFGKEVSFCPVVSKYCWQEQSSEECNEESLEIEDESEDELLDNADATVIYNTKENENIASKYNEEFLKREKQENICKQPNNDDDMIKEKAALKEFKNITLTQENTQRVAEMCGNETQQREENTTTKSTINTQHSNETVEHEECNEALTTAVQSNNGTPAVTTISLTTNVNNETLKPETGRVVTEENKIVNKDTNTSTVATKPTVVVARPLSIQLPILSEPPINRAHHILYASQQMLDHFQRQQENKEHEHFKSQSTQNLSKMSGKTADIQQPTSNSKLNNNNEIIKSKFKHEEKHPNSKGFLSRFANGFRFSLRRNKKKLQRKENQLVESEQEQNKTNGQANQNKTKSLPAANKQADFIHIPLKGPLPVNRNGNAKAQTNVSSSSNGNAKNATVLLKQKGAKTKDTNDKQQKVTGKPPIPPQQQQQIQQLQKMQSAQSSLQQEQPQQQPLVEVGLSRFYTETEGNNNPTTAPNPYAVTQDFLTSERGLYNENHNQQQFTTSRQSCANNQLLTSAENDTKMTAVNTNNTATYEFTSPSRATVSQKTQMFNNLSRKSEQPKIGLIETNLDTHETIITGKTRSLINIAPNSQQQRYAGKRLHTTINSQHNHHQQQYNRHHLDGNEADDDEYDDNDDDEVVVRPDGTVVVIKNAGTNGSSSSSQTAQIVSVRRPHKSMEFLLDKENQKDVMITSDDSQADGHEKESENSEEGVDFTNPIKPLRKKKLRRTLTWKKDATVEEAHRNVTTDSDSDRKIAEPKARNKTLYLQSQQYEISNIAAVELPPESCLDELSSSPSPCHNKGSYHNEYTKCETCSSERSKELSAVSTKTVSKAERTKSLVDSFIDLGFETGSNEMDSPIRATKRSDFVIKYANSSGGQLEPQTQNPSFFSTPIKGYLQEPEYFANSSKQQQLFSPITMPLKSRRKSICDTESLRSSLAMQVIREDQPLEHQQMNSPCYSNTSQEISTDLSDLCADKTSQFWIKCGDFSIYIDIDYNDAERVRLLYDIFSQKSNDSRDLHFGIDNKKFSVHHSYNRVNISKHLPTSKEFSHYWFATGDFAISFSGKLLPPDKIQRLFEFVKSSVEDSGILSFGVDAVEFSNVSELWNQSPKFSMDSNYSMLVGLQSGDSNGLEGRSKFAWPHCKPVRISDLDQSDYEYEDFEDNESSRLLMSPFGSNHLDLATLGFEKLSLPRNSEALMNRESFIFDYENEPLDQLFDETQNAKRMPIKEQPTAVPDIFNALKAHHERLNSLREKLLHYNNSTNLSNNILDDDDKGTPQYLNKLKNIVSEINNKDLSGGFKDCTAQELENYMLFLNRYAAICLQRCTDHMDMLLNVLTNKKLAV